ncbi:FadR/GntR family transcriptional regulator [Mesorhizobium sp. SB112]|uniref:FadR/GntR family transcriptional regulator n=1 Tax=Mesorhizobium sp. SB112 TaxID=3151853 RepID=UPI003265090E
MTRADNNRTGPERKLGDYIYDGIFKLITSGEFAELSRLPSESELGQRFGASRPIIREALARLREDGLIQSRQGSGSFVLRRPDANVLRFVEIGSVSDIQRCYDFRIGFEAASASLAARSWEQDELQELQASLSELEECIATKKLGVDADARFHRAVALATRNPYHIMVHNSLEQNVRVGMNLARNLSLLRPVARLQLVQQEHIEIFNAIEQRRPEEAGELMALHISSARKRMFDGL